MRKILIVIIVIIIFFYIYADISLLKYKNTQYNVLIYFPSNFKRMENSNGIVFYNDIYGITLSLLFAKSYYSPRDHIVSIEQAYNSLNTIDSMSMYLSEAECDTFNIDEGIKSHFIYYKDMQPVNKSIIAMKRDSTVYMIIVDFMGEQEDKIIELINKSIATFRVTKGNE